MTSSTSDVAEKVVLVSSLDNIAQVPVETDTPPNYAGVLADEKFADLVCWRPRRYFPLYPDVKIQPEPQPQRSDVVYLLSPFAGSHYNPRPPEPPRRATAADFGVREQDNDKKKRDACIGVAQAEKV